jgi:hypothetical protein
VSSRFVTEGPVQPFGYGRAFVDYITVTSPAAGAQKAVTVQGEWWIRVLHARLSITTDANAANRFIALDFINARSQTFARNGAGVVVTANTTGQAFEWDFHRTVAEWAANTPVFAPLSPLFLEPGFTVQFSVDSIQATDQISGLSLVVEKWPTGPRGETVADYAEPTRAGY